jgi:catechol 2,3-dioxygenase-like lactoylglutathione lyase family enzyme
MRIKMCSIHVNDPAQAFAFYTQILGFDELFVIPDANLYIVKSPEDPVGVGLLLEPSDNPIARAYKEGVYGAGMPTIVFGVKDVPAEYARLTSAGVRFTGEPTVDEAGTHAVFDDTCGNLVQIHQD